MLQLIIREETCQCTRWDGVTFNKNYTAGALYSTSLYKFGYFEIRCKIPELNGSTSTGKGLGPNFWFWPLPANSYDPNITDVIYSEIDIFEFDGEFNLHTCNVHYDDIYHSDGNPNTIHWSLRKEPYFFDFQVDFSTFHTFGCEWTPNYISFYFNNKLIRTTNTEFAKKLLPMNLIVDINIPAFGKHPASNTLFPYIYEVDYVKVYKLTMDCDADITQENFNYLNYDNKVKRNITIGGINGLIPSGVSVSLRATESITLNDGFEVSINSQFFANNCNCEN